MADSPRKRTERKPPSPQITVTNEPSLVTTHAQSTANDHSATSPTIPPRNSSSNNPAPTSSSHSKPSDAQRDGAEREAAAEERRDRGAWRAFWEKYGSVELENKGSVARDHLALERTFLAWLRTSLSFASIGIAITQLFRLNTNLSNSPSSSAHTASHTPQVLFSLAESPQAKIRHLGKPLGATFIAISIVMLFIGFHRYFEAQHYVIRGKFPASRGSIILVSAISGALIGSSLVVILVTAPSVFER